MTQPSAPLFTFNDLLRLSGLVEDEVLVFRHRPYEPQLNRLFDWIVAERPELFDCYQSTHGPRTEAAMKRAKYVAAFIRHRPGTALFAGMYAMNGYRVLDTQSCVARPAHVALMNLGMVGIKATDGRESLLEFDLSLLDWHSDWSGRLVVRWPGLERSWYRWANRNEFAVEAIAEESIFAAKMPAWDELVLSWAELAALPSQWQSALRQWRGIYLITDESDGKQYVGSAYGGENLLQRWMEYGRSGHGGNKLLRGRDPTRFRFAILQRLSPDLADADVIRSEVTWKDRLHTRAPAGLNDN
jgi:hypothetical protein